LSNNQVKLRPFYTAFWTEPLIYGR